jgi:hypothetical protein
MTTRKQSNRRTLTDIKRELADVARVGQMFVDGDLCRQALKPYAQTFMTGDDMDFDPAACVPLKKTLIRLERLCRVPCSTTIWRRRPDMPDRVEAILFGAYSSPMSDGKPGNRGYKPPMIFREIAKAFEQGKSAWKISRKKTKAMVDRGLFYRVRDVTDPVVVETFVPVKDSMGEIAAVLEVFTVAKGK